MARPSHEHFFVTTAGWVVAIVLTAACSGSGQPTVTGPGASSPSATTAPGPSAAGASDPAPTSGPGAPAGPAKAPVKAAQPDRVVATVNGVSIKLSQVEEVSQANRMQIQARGAVLSDADEKKLRATALRALLADELLYQASKAADIKPAPEEVDGEMQLAKAQLGTEQNFKKFLEQNALTEEDVRREAERRLQVRKYMKSVTQGVAVPEADAKGFYDANQERFRMPEMVRASIIVVKSTPDEPQEKRADARRRIEEAKKRADAGEDFAALAKQYSQVDSAAQGGDLGFFPKGVMFPKLEEIAFTTAPGKASSVFETPTGFNVLKVAEKRESQIQPFDEVKARLTLDMARFMEGRAVEAKLGELVQAAKIEILDPTLDLDKIEAAEAKPPAAPANPAAKTK